MQRDYNMIAIIYSIIMIISSLEIAEILINYKITSENKIIDKACLFLIGNIL
jgi:hypothetical protein